MNSRDAILGRIREALREPAGRPGQHDGVHAPLPTNAAGFRQWLPRVGADWDAQCQLFAQNAAMLKAEFKVVPNTAAAATEVRRIASDGKWKNIATHAGVLTDAVCKAAGTELLYTDKAYSTADLEKCDGGVSACEALIAQTGSVLVTSRSCGGRALSVLPPHHIVVATRAQLLPDLPAAFEQGHGCWLETADGGRFLDFGAGIATSSLGHGHKHLTDVIAKQAHKLMHVSNLYRIPQAERLAQRLVDASFADSVFFCSEIQATDSTHTGCRAKNSAASQGTIRCRNSRVRTSASRHAAAACRSTFSR